MLMAGLDGVQNKIHPGDPIDKNLYDLEPEEAAKVPHPCASLDEALENLDKDREFLTRGGVFSNDMIDAYIALKKEEVTRFRMTTHPVEFEMYYTPVSRGTRRTRAGVDPTRGGPSARPFVASGDRGRLHFRSRMERDMTTAAGSRVLPRLAWRCACGSRRSTSAARRRRRVARQQALRVRDARAARRDRQRRCTNVHAAVRARRKRSATCPTAAAPTTASPTRAASAAVERRRDRDGRRRRRRTSRASTPSTQKRARRRAPPDPRGRARAARRSCSPRRASASATSSRTRSRCAAERRRAEVRRPRSRSADAQNVDKLHERIRGLQAQLAEHEKNIEALKKELGALKPLASSSSHSGAASRRRASALGWRAYCFLVRSSRRRRRSFAGSSCSRPPCCCSTSDCT